MTKNSLASFIMPAVGELLSEGYRAQLRRKHAACAWGIFGKQYLPEVLQFARALGGSSILDYGSGRGTLGAWLRPHGFKVRDYDPAIAGRESLPEVADLVISTDVLEHIEPECLDNVLAHIRALARRGVFLVIALRPALHRLPDGRNAHLIIEGRDWWVGRLIGAGIPVTRESRIERLSLLVWSELS